MGRLQEYLILRMGSSGIVLALVGALAIGSLVAAESGVGNPAEDPIGNAIIPGLFVVVVTLALLYCGGCLGGDPKGSGRRPHSFRSTKRMMEEEDDEDEDDKDK